MTTGNITHHLTVDATQAVRTLTLHRQLLELHRPSQRPYPGAPGFVLTQCRVCDGQRSTVQQTTDTPRACQVWQDATDQGVTAC